jgi:hypothetical protein
MIPSKSGSPALWWKLAILTAAALFALLAVWNIDLPGLYYDEVIQVSTALGVVKAHVQSQLSGEPRSEIAYHQRRLALMTMGYLGGLKTIAFVPIAAAVKLGPKSIRSFTILIGTLALIATAAFARRFLGPPAAALAAILLATDASYLIFCRTDYGPIALMMLLKSVALWQLMIWWQSGHSWALYRAAFAMGLGVYDKAKFLWIVMALAGAVLLIAPSSFTRLTRKETLRAACLFMVGCLPLILYNLDWPPPTWTALKSQNINARRGETSVPRSLKELEGRFRQRTGVLAGLLTARNVRYVRGFPAPRTALTSMVACAAFVVTLTCYCLPRLRRQWRREMLLALAMFFIVLLAALTPGADADHHLILTYPFPHLLVAAVVIRGAGWCYRMRTPLGVIAALAVFLTGAAGPVMAGVLRYRQVMVQLQKTGGTGSWSDGIYELDAWLESHDPSQPVIAVDWGIGQNLAVLSQGRLPCVELWFAPDAARYQEFFKMPESRYVLHAPDVTEFPQARALFLETVQARGLQLHSVKTIADRTGRPVFLVYTLSRRIDAEPLPEGR